MRGPGHGVSASVHMVSNVKSKNSSDFGHFILASKKISPAAQISLQILLMSLTVH